MWKIQLRDLLTAINLHLNTQNGFRWFEFDDLNDFRATNITYELKVKNKNVY